MTNESRSGDGFGPGEALAALRLLLAWGADECIGDAPADRLARPAPLPVANARAEPASERPPAAALPVAGAPATPAAARARDWAASANTLGELRSALDAFEECALATTATRLVFADGDPATGLLLVGDAPSGEDDRAGRPFQGPDGALLDRMLSSIGLSRQSALLTTLVPWRPPGNRAPTEAEIGMCLPFLLRLIALARPRRIVLLGPVPTRALLGAAAPFRRLRGRWTELTTPELPAAIPCLPTYHPSALARTPPSKREAWADLRALKRALDGDLAKL